jgi:hypothetical protein
MAPAGDVGQKSLPHPKRYGERRPTYTADRMN